MISFRKCTFAQSEYSIIKLNGYVLLGGTNSGLNNLTSCVLVQQLQTKTHFYVWDGVYENGFYDLCNLNYFLEWWDVPGCTDIQARLRDSRPAVHTIHAT